MCTERVGIQPAAELIVLAERSRRPDAAGMAELSLEVARCTRHLVEVNLALSRVDARRGQIAKLVEWFLKLA